MRYIELNPVRANMAEHPALYRCSSFHHNSGIKQFSFISAHPIYNALGRNIKERALNYLQPFEQHFTIYEVSVIQATWQTGTLLGDSVFKEKVGTQSKQKIGQDFRGRPIKRRGK